MTMKDIKTTRVPLQSLPKVPTPLSYDDYRGTNTPLVIDNGATTLRYGFATFDTPLQGPNMVAKYKDRRTNRPLLLFGDGVESEGGARSQAKMPWEGDVLLNFDALVSVAFVFHCCLWTCVISAGEMMVGFITGECLGLRFHPAWHRRI